MARTCNIDARGKLVRLIYGVVLLVIAFALLIVWALPGNSVWGWVVTVVCFLSGALAIYEARAGWCVMRAMGFKTPV
jgi:hypothetical protein